MALTDPVVQATNILNSENSNYCPMFVWEFLSSRRQTPEVWNFCVFTVFEFFVPPTEKLPSLLRTEIPIFCLSCFLWPSNAQGLFEGTCAHGIRRGRSRHTIIIKRGVDAMRVDFLNLSEHSSIVKKREGVPEMGTRPLKALRGYRASNQGSKGL